MSETSYGTLASSGESSPRDCSLRFDHGHVSGSTTDTLRLRGAIALLSRAMAHIGKGHRMSNGIYMNDAIEKADGHLRLALWRVEEDLKRENV